MVEGSSKVSGAVYMAGQEHLDLLLEAYGIYSNTNPLHTDVWPSMRQLEADVIAMTAAMLGGQCAWQQPPFCIITVMDNGKITTMPGP